MVASANFNQIDSLFPRVKGIHIYQNRGPKPISRGDNLKRTKICNLYTIICSNHVILSFASLRRIYPILIKEFEKTTLILKKATLDIFLHNCHFLKIKPTYFSQTARINRWHHFLGACISTLRHALDFPPK